MSHHGGRIPGFLHFNTAYSEVYDWREETESEEIRWSAPMRPNAKSAQQCVIHNLDYLEPGPAWWCQPVMLKTVSRLTPGIPLPQCVRSQNS